MAKKKASKKTASNNDAPANSKKKKKGAKFQTKAERTAKLNKRYGRHVE